VSTGGDVTPSTVEVPIPQEFKILARIRGIPEERLIRAVQRLLILEAISLNSELKPEDVKEISKKVGKAAWRSL